MALGNLSIKVNADIGGFVSSLDIASKAAQKGMGASADSVDDFRASLMHASDDMARAARSMSGNMEAANDAIASSSKKAAESVKDVSKSIEEIDTRSMSEKVGFAIGAGAAAGYATAKTALDAFTEYVKAKLIIAGIAILTGITAAFLTTIYLAYKAINAIGAMMDGSFFKSKNIDSLVAANKELLDLQQNLRLSSIEAGALNEALKRLGVDKNDYTSVYANAATAVRSNADELDRLGVKYKDNNGKLLESRQVIENVKGVLDTYTEGWDRNAAATAIGIGSYEKITQTLKVTSAEVQTSKERLDEYQLGVTAGTQQMVTDYQTAMREFSRENDLAAEGFKRVYADAVMPIYTDMANLFKEGWPIMVQATRLGMSSIMFFVYSMADGIYIAKESITASFSAIGTSIAAAAAASAAAMRGNFAGAKDALVAGWEDASKRVKLAGSNMVDQVMKNDRALAMATGNDGRSASIASSKLPPVVSGKTFLPKPLAEKDGGRAGSSDDPAKKLLLGQIAEQEAFIAAEKTQLATREGYLQYYYQLEYTKANEFYGTKNALIQDALKTQLAAYDKEAAAAAIYLAQADTAVKKQDARNTLAEIAKKRTAAEIEANKKLTDSVLEQARAYREFDLATTQVARQYQLSNDQARFQIELLGKGTLEVAKLTAEKRIDLALEQRLYDMRNKGLPEAEQARAAAEAIKQKRVEVDLLTDRYTRQRTAAFGANEALRKYAESATNDGAQIESALTNAFKNAEDALVNFVKTGKLDFKSLADNIINDLIRIQIQRSVTAPLSQALNSGGSGFVDSGVSFVKNLFGFANGGEPPVGVPSIVGENGPEIFIPKTPGTVLPNGVGMGGSMVVNIIESPGNGGQQNRRTEGGVDILDVMVERIKSSIAGDITRGDGMVPNAMTKSYGLNRAAGAY